MGLTDWVVGPLGPHEHIGASSSTSSTTSSSLFDIYTTGGWEGSSMSERQWYCREIAAKQQNSHIDGMTASTVDKPWSHKRDCLGIDLDLDFAMMHSGECHRYQLADLVTGARFSTILVNHGSDSTSAIQYILLVFFFGRFCLQFNSTRLHTVRWPLRSQREERVD
jgi:hypothetical protein